MTHKEKIELTRKLHEILCGLSGQDIALVASDPPGRTDTESYIALPIEDPDVDIIHRHEWSHILFKTQLHARDLFIGKYLEELEKRGAVSIDNGPEVESFIVLVCNALDDIRVTSLQMLIYPMSAMRAMDRWKKKVLNAPASNIVGRIIGLGSGMSIKDLPSSPWSRYDREITTAIGMVQRESYTAVLLATRYLLDSITDFAEMPLGQGLEEATIPAPTEPARRLSRSRRRRSQDFNPEKACLTLTKLSLQAQSLASIVDTELPHGARDHEPERSQKMVQAAMGSVEPEQLAQIMNESRAEVQTIAASLQRRLHEPNPDDRLSSGLGRVEFVNLPPSDVEEFVLSDDDLKVVEHLHQQFLRLHDIRDRRRTDEGSTLDTERYIDFILGHGDQDFFIEDTPVRGFVLLTLVDMSGSMLRRWTTVSRAAKVAACSTHFPFSHREFWAFSGSQSGETAIVRFQDPEKGYFPTRHIPQAWGLTPLHVGIEASVRRLRQLEAQTRQLLVVTDGNPQQIDQLPTVLRDSVAKTVAEARRSAVSVSALIVGHEVTDQEATHMFGPGRWKRIEDLQESLFYEMVDLVRMTFTHHLRR